MTIKTLYTVLGVEPGASQPEIEDAFLRIRAGYPQSKLAADPSARARFQPLQQAYATLSNPKSRSLYDQKLAAAGIRVARPAAVQDVEGVSWLSTRNKVVAGAIFLIGLGLWMYNGQEETLERKAVAERALKIAEEERRRQAEARAQQEQVRQTLDEGAQRRREEDAARQNRSDAQRVGRELQRQQQEAEAARQHAQYEEEQRKRMREMAQSQAEQDARRRLDEEKRQLQEICMQKYGRPDC